MSLASLRGFCALAEHLHYGQAAGELGISVPSLSQQISRLEKSIGVTLFERSSRRVELTPAGAEMLPLALRVREEYDDVVQWALARREREADAQLLRVGLVAAGAGGLTTSILTAAIQHLPDVRLEMRRLGFFEIREQLLTGAVDVVIGPGPILTDDRIRIAKLGTEPRVLAVAASHRLAGRASISIGEIRDETFLAASGGSPEILDWWLVDPRPDGSHPKRGPVADDIEGLLELTAAGIGVNITAASAATHYGRETLSFVPIDDIAPATMLLCSLVRPRSMAVHPFEQIAARVAAEAAPMRA